LTFATVYQNQVITAKTVNNFEINLDKYWEAQEFKYDHTANINLTSKPGSDVKYAVKHCRRRGGYSDFSKPASTVEPNLT